MKLRVIFLIPKADTNNTPTVAINFHINDLSYAKFLIGKLGYGSIQMDHFSLQAFKLVIRNKEGILDIISLVNGKFRTPKINKLHSLIDFINSDPTKYK